MGDGGYVRQRAGMLSMTSSHMWGKQNLPMFLLRDGLLTLGHPLAPCVTLYTSMHY